MLLPIPILIRDSASGPPLEREIGIDPESIARVEPADDDPATCWLHVDGGAKPYRVPGTVADLIGYVNYFLCEEADPTDLTDPTDRTDRTPPPDPRPPTPAPQPCVTTPAA